MGLSDLVASIQLNGGSLRVTGGTYSPAYSTSKAHSDCDCADCASDNCDCSADCSDCHCTDCNEGSDCNDD